MNKKELIKELKELEFYYNLYKSKYEYYKAIEKDATLINGFLLLMNSQRRKQDFIIQILAA